MPDDHEDIVQIIPGGGYRAVYAQDDGAYSSPVLAWALVRNGSVRGMYTTPDGDCGFVDDRSNFVAIFHPAEELWRREPTFDEEL